MLERSPLPVVDGFLEDSTGSSQKLCRESFHRKNCLMTEIYNFTITAEILARWRIFIVNKRTDT